MVRVVLTGPESTGKSMLTRSLADHFGGIGVPEYAREYIERLKRPYTEEDVLTIARHQAGQFATPGNTDRPFFFDTGLIITRVWLEVVYQASYDWIDKALENAGIDLYLLCYPDLPWEPDPLRENGGAMRFRLYEQYRVVLEAFGFPYHIVKGQGEERLNNAIFAVDQILK